LTAPRRSYGKSERQRSPIEVVGGSSGNSPSEGLEMAYEQLPIVEVDLDGLLLDLENYRIPTRRDD